MREPDFWWRPGKGSLLVPFAAIYGAVAALRLQGSGEKAGLPVVCLGNLTVGGAGKTPAAIAVAQLLHAAHLRPFFLSRGYGGQFAGPVRVNSALHRARDVGDEPLLLTRLAPTIVARDRVAGAKLAQFAGAGVVVMDDGLQNASLVKDLSIIVVDGRRGIGNGHIIPAGPLRAPLGLQLDRARALIVVGPPDGAAAVIERARRRELAIFHARLEPDRNVIAAIGRRKALAFAGIGDPEKFFTTLATAGIEVADTASFPDHHRYTAKDAAALIARAQAKNLILVTTEKDLVRMTGEPDLEALARRTSALPVRLIIDEADLFRQMLLQAVKRKPHGLRK
ncbi:MAG TPA: tetraacyldisaccharide 4'-kinase [Xanthobacteraceae bacterium]|nr:tetraacyldisaccharide 4'-kinase [Xanthobacteraceae bacterium]